MRPIASMSDLGHYSTVDLFNACVERRVTPEAAAEELHRRRVRALDRASRRAIRAAIVATAVFDEVRRALRL